MERIKIRGLALGSAVAVGVWGFVVAAKGLFDIFIGEPEANRYSSRPWEFITQEAWLRYGGFELVYGLSCLALAWVVWRYSRFLPEVVSRPRREPEFQLFD